MNPYSTPVDFWMVFIAGMVAVAVHAHSLYQTAVPRSNNDPIDNVLAPLSISLISGRNHFYKGFVFYLLVSEVVYLVLAFSSGVLLLSLNILGRDDLAGAISGDPSMNPIVPLAASTVYIAASQLPPATRIEQTLRRLAHSIAGIPDTLYDVQERIRNAKFEVSDKCKTITISTAGSGAPVIIKGEDADAFLARSRLSETSPPNPASDGKTIKDLEDTLLRIAFLFEWTLGRTGAKLWTNEDTEILKSLTNTDADKDSYSTLIEQIRITKADYDISEIEEKAHKLEQKLVLLLALFLLNNPDTSLKENEALNSLQQSAHSRDSRDLADAHLLYIATAALFALFLITTYYQMSEHVEDIVKVRIEYEKLGPRHAANFSEIPLPTLLLSELRGDDGLSEASNSRIDNALITFFTNVSGNLSKAAWDVVNYLLIFALSVATCSVVLFSRKYKRSERRNSENSTQSLNRVLPFFSIGLVGYVISAAAFISLNFLWIAVRAAHITKVPTFSEINITQFLDELPRLVVFPVFSIACAWLVYEDYRTQLLTKRQNSDKAKGTNTNNGGSTTPRSLLGNRAFPFLIILVSALSWVFYLAPLLIISLVAEYRGYNLIYLIGILVLTLCVLAIMAFFCRSIFMGGKLLTSLYFGFFIGTASLLIDTALLRNELGWEIADSFLVPFICFATFSLAYLNQFAAQDFVEGGDMTNVQDSGEVTEDSEDNKDSGTDGSTQQFNDSIERKVET